MRMPSGNAVSDVSLRDKGTKRLVLAEDLGQMTCESVAKYGKVPSILPINDKFHLSNENK